MFMDGRNTAQPTQRITYLRKQCKCLFLCIAFALIQKHQEYKKHPEWGLPAQLNADVNTDKQ